MTKVQKLQSKLGEWHARMDGSDVHSIWRQVNNMLWRSAFYRSINESRSLLPDRPNGDKRANGWLHEFVNDGYFIGHAMTIRRLIDQRRSAHSLYKLVEDIKDSAALLTRENMLAARGLTYDFESIELQARKEAQREAENSGERAWAVPAAGWSDAKCWHENCDVLSAVSAVTRQTTDTPTRAQFEAVLEYLGNQGRAVKTYVDKYVAHAAPPRERSGISMDERNLTLHHLWLAERAIFKVTSFVWLRIVDGATRGNVPIPQFNQFEYLDEPFAAKAALVRMREAWTSHCDEISACRASTWDDVTKQESK